MEAQIATNAAGDYALGFTTDGAFVPLAVVAKHRVGHLIERQATLKARADDPGHEGHGPALDTLEADWKVIETPKRSSSSSSSKSTKPDPAKEA